MSDKFPAAALFWLFFLSSGLHAQSFNDGIFMEKKFLCAAVLGQQDRWNHYWEGTLNRTNGNIGTVSTTRVMPMLNYGVSDNFNVLAQLPYVQTASSAGTLAGQQGFQDLTLGIKYKLAKFDLSNGVLSGQLVAGGSTPVTRYVADYLPLSLGLGCRTLFGKAMINYYGKNNLIFLLSAGMIARSSIELDRNTYYTTQQVYSQTVDLPNAAQYAFRGGYYSFRWGLEATAEQFVTLGGFDIRRQDMPFPSNRMNATNIGLVGFYRVPLFHDLQVLASISRVVYGRNTGQALAFTFGLPHFFNFNQ